MHNWILLKFFGEVADSSSCRKTQVVFHQAVRLLALTQAKERLVVLNFCVACQLARLSYLA
jgi:hypothetical protein